ncbi:response regulator [Lysobacter soli]|uniref:response regulator n=1 Tax=Lysobacter soli TaxID=453783 RepID=UPI0037C7A972
MKRSMLLVDDNALLCEIVAEELRNLGLEVHVAHDGAEAEALLRRRHFDAALVDFDLPHGMTGLHVARRASKLQPSIRVILTSGYELADLKLPAGVTFLAKPYLLSQVVVELFRLGPSAPSRPSIATERSRDQGCA